MTRILIIGASSGIGLETARLALTKGFAVRALARSVDKMSLSDPSLEKFSADATNRESLVRAVVGVDVVIQTLGVRVKSCLVQCDSSQILLRL